MRSVVWEGGNRKTLSCLPCVCDNCSIRTPLEWGSPIQGVPSLIRSICHNKSNWQSIKRGLYICIYIYTYVFIFLSLTDEGENKFEVIYASDTVLVVSVVNKDKNKRCGEIQLAAIFGTYDISYLHWHGHETFPLSILLFRKSACGDSIHSSVYKTCLFLFSELRTLELNLPRKRSW